MTRSAETVALETLDLLGPRLKRLELLFGLNEDEEERNSQPPRSIDEEHTVATRIARLEQSLYNIVARSNTAQSLLEFLLEARYPALFDDSDDKTPLLTPEGALAIVLASGPLYHSTASRLNSINDMLPHPTADSSAQLIALQPRVAKIQLLQAAQVQQMADLRSRTAAVLERWYEIGIMSSGDCWNDWEKRMSQAELKIRQRSRTE